MPKILWSVVLVLVIGVLAGGGVWLSQRETGAGLEAGTLITEEASEALVGRTAEVRVPWGSLQVTVSEPIPQTGEGQQAGHDASLVGVQVALDGPEDLLVADRLPGGALLDPTFTLVADDREYLLEGLTGWITDNVVDQVARRQYVALKGTPSTISLRVRYDGVDQVVDGLTGEVDRAGADPLYNLAFAGGAQVCADPLWGPEAGDTGDTVTRCLVTSTAQRPYVAGLGWAPTGKSWLVVTVLPGAPSQFDGPDGTYQVESSASTYLLDGKAPEQTFGLNETTAVDGAEDPSTTEETGVDATDPQVAIFEIDPARPTGQFEVRTKLTGTTEVTGKRGPARTKTFDTVVAQGAFV